jgi:hypothetical protein
MQWYKVLAEDYLRQSKLDYLIIRPTGLRNGEEATSFTISQGDKIEGCINVATVGRLTVDTLLDPWIRPNTSLECLTSDEQAKQPYQYIQGMYHLQPENDNQKKIVNHKIPARLVYSSFWAVLLTATYLGFRFARIYLPWKRFMNYFSRLIGRGNI